MKKISLRRMFKGKDKNLLIEAPGMNFQVMIEVESLKKGIYDKTVSSFHPLLFPIEGFPSQYSKEKKQKILNTKVAILHRTTIGGYYEYEVKGFIKKKLGYKILKSFKKEYIIYKLTDEEALKIRKEVLLKVLSQ